MTRDGRVALWWWVTLGLGNAVVWAGGTSRWSLAGVLILMDAFACWQFRAAAQALFRR
jgi:hypothetical protein